MYVSLLSKRIRIDKGIETDLMTTLHVLAHMKVNHEKTKQEIMDSYVLYGPSTENKIER